MAEQDTDPQQNGDVSKQGQSAYVLYSLGVVAENKLLSSDMIFVTPQEDFPFLTGALKETREDITVKSVDSQGTTTESTATASSTIEAKWMQDGSNRRTPPDVRRGEAVKIYRQGDSDIYWWQPLGTGDNLRRLETVIWAVSDIPEGDKEVPLTPENQYALEVSTHTKTITLTTAKSNGEPFAYTIQVNAADGKVIITDDVDNYIFLDSNESMIELKTAAEARVSLLKDSIELDAPKDISIKAGGSITIEAKNDITTTSQQNAITASTSYGLTSPSGAFNVSNWTYNDTGGGNAGTMTFGGNMTLKGQGTFQQGVTMGQTLQVSGNTKVGSLNSDGPIYGSNFP